MGFILCYLYNLISGKFFLNYFPMKTCLFNKPFSIDALVHYYFSHTYKQYCSSDCIKDLLNKLLNFYFLIA